jgi:hypothetical protein
MAGMACVRTKPASKKATTSKNRSTASKNAPTSEGHAPHTPQTSTPDVSRKGGNLGRGGAFKSGCAAPKNTSSVNATGSPRGGGKGSSVEKGGGGLLERLEACRGNAFGLKACDGNRFGNGFGTGKAGRNRKRTGAGRGEGGGGGGGGERPEEDMSGKKLDKVRTADEVRPQTINRKH